VNEEEKEEEGEAKAVIEVDAEWDIYIYIYIYIRHIYAVSAFIAAIASSREHQGRGVHLVQRYCTGRRDSQRLAPLRKRARESIRDDTPVSSAHTLSLRGFSLTAVEVVY
jgi:hypothetical protein